MNPRLPPAEPIVATITISVVVMLAAPNGSISAKKKSAAIVGPSSITPNDSVRYEFIAHNATENKRPQTTARTLIGGVGASWFMFGPFLDMLCRPWLAASILGFRHVERATIHTSMRVVSIRRLVALVVALIVAVVTAISPYSSVIGGEA
jgi:hypothetical protein